MSQLALRGGSQVRTAPWPQWPVFDEEDELLLLDVLRSGNWWRHSYGEGIELAEDETTPKSMVARFQREFARAHDCMYGICAANGTVTMEIGLRAMGIRPGDEVIVPAYTYVATATAVLMVGAVPIFVDIDPETYNIDPICVEKAITQRTTAIIPVHFGGQPCDMDAINDLARKNNLKVLEDAAHAHGSAYNGRKCGSLADMGSFSFQLSKNMTAGEGGVITTNNTDYAEACEMLVWAGRKKGHPWYQHFVLASNARMTEFQGALLLGQLRRLPDQNARRETNARLLDDLLESIEGIAPLKTRPSTTSHSHHIYMFRYQSEAFARLDKRRFVSALQAEGITGAFAGYTMPLYENPMFTERNFFGGSWPLDTWEHSSQLDYATFKEHCPVSERACATEAVWIPQTMLLADEEAIHDIANAIKKVQAHTEELV